MATCTLTIHVAWWLKPYCYTLAAICAITGREPNWERANYWIIKALSVKAK